MLKNIMVHLDSASSCSERIQLAGKLAQQHGARLTGLYVFSSPRLTEPDRQLAEARELFAEQTRDSGIATEFLQADTGFLHTGITEMVGYYASFADLLVVSQPLQADRNKKYEVITSPERLLLGTGKPVLVLPQHGSAQKIGERIMVAWKAGPKASRATHDAMPLLRLAKHVNMVSIGDAMFARDESSRLADYLTLHDVKAHVESIPQGALGVGDTLLNLAADDQIDMMVLGVHIANRRGRLDMGEVGAYLLRQMTVPMLLSH